MSNKIIQSFWFGSQLSNNELLCLRSFIYHGHEFHLYAYDEIADLPEGVAIKDANTIIPSSSIFKDTHNTYASFADVFRLQLLFLKGGWWMDMDVVCLRPFEVQEEYCFSSEWNANLEAKDINNTCVKSPSGASWMEGLLERIWKRIENGDPVRWGEIGVYLFRKELGQDSNIRKYMKDPEVFCPINYFDLSGLICDNGYMQDNATLAIHLWNEIWRRGNLNKNARYHPDSIYEKLKRKYL
jgi:hypothetical protein